MAKNWKLITDGLVKNNPTFVLLLGMCPTPLSWSCRTWLSP